MGIINAENLKHKNNSSEEENIITDSHSNNYYIKDDLVDYAIKRMTSGIINESNKRATFLVEEETLRELDDLVNFVEATNGIGTKYQENKTQEEIRKERLLAKGFKSKIVNFAIQSVLEKWKNDEDLIPEVNKVRYKVNKVYHRAYYLEHNGETYGIEQDNRGNELQYLATTNGNSQEEIKDWFKEKEGLV